MVGGSAFPGISAPPPRPPTWHNCCFQNPRKRLPNHDDARPDAPTQGLAQMEPGHRDSGVHSSVYPQLPEDRHGAGTTTSWRRSKGATSLSAGSGRPTSGRCRRIARSSAATSTSKMLKQLGIDQRIVQQMIEEETALAEASRLGITATDEEVRARIATMPGLQENGQFMGEQRYAQILQMQNPPLTAGRFRGRDPPRRDDREAAGGAHELDHGQRQGRRGRVPAAQRESEARRRCRSRPTSFARDSTRPTPS